jgi:uroporphyrinogen decarboxylase
MMDTAHFSGRQQKIEPDFTRFIKAVRRGQPDRVPLAELYVEQNVQELFLGRKIVSPQDTVDFWVNAGYDYVSIRLPYPLSPRAIGEKRGDRHWAPESQGLIRSKTDLQLLDIPLDFDYSSFIDTARCLPGSMKIVARGGDIFTLTWSLLGFESFARLIYEDSDFVEAVLEKVARIILGAFEKVLDCQALGALWYTDDLAYAEGLLVSPSFYRKYLFPKVAEIGQMAKKKNLCFLYHTDGRIWEVVEDIINCGVECIHPIEPKAMDALEFKKKFGARVSIAGAIELDTLVRGTPGEVSRLVRWQMERLSQGGGYLAGSSNSIASFVPVENYIAMLETVREYGTYHNSQST